jgi:membrane-associated phospholipid phosphatase
MLRCLLLLQFILIVANCFAQTDTMPPPQPAKQSKASKPALFIVPSAMIAYGVTALNSKSLIRINQQVKQTVWEKNPHKKIHIDDYAVFAPAAAVYILNAAGVKGKHNFIDRSFLYGTSLLLSTAVTVSVKNISKERRPDSSNLFSFPSGHTSSAFVAAEFLRMEYKDVSPWYGVAGYAVAAGTGFLRIYNNKHWLSDVVAGAGIGILSVQAAYWIYPVIKKKFSKNKPRTTVILPYYQQHSAGIVYVLAM